jgi:hypothetical protein
MHYIFLNQFNIHADVGVAWEFFQNARKSKIPLKLVPTECAKGSLWKPSPYEWTLQRY